MSFSFLTTCNAGIGLGAFPQHFRSAKSMSPGISDQLCRSNEWEDDQLTLSLYKFHQPGQISWLMTDWKGRDWVGDGTEMRLKRRRKESSRRLRSSDASLQVRRHWWVKLCSCPGDQIWSPYHIGVMKRYYPWQTGKFPNNAANFWS